MIARVDGLERLRLSSIEPIDISEDLFGALSDLRSFCEHLHMPLQSGSDPVLHAMNRPYTVREFSRLVERSRDLFPDIAISTDVIVGFPGETREQFDETLEFVRATEFSRLHVFKFSARKGTRAALMNGRVHPEEMSLRSEQLIRLGAHLMHQFHGRFVGRQLEILTEESSKPPSLEGMSRNYIRTEFTGDASDINEIVKVMVESASPSGCRGFRVSDSPSDP